MSEESLHRLRRLVACHGPLFAASCGSSISSSSSGSGGSRCKRNEKEVMEESVNECLRGVVDVLSTVVSSSSLEDWKTPVEYVVGLIVSSSSCHGRHLVWEMLVSCLSSMWESLHVCVREWILDWLSRMVETDTEFHDTLHVLQEILFRDDSMLARILGVLSQIKTSNNNNNNNNNNKAILDLCLSSLTILSPHDWPTLLQTLSGCLNNNDDDNDNNDLDAIWYGTQEASSHRHADQEYLEMMVTTVQSVRREWDAVEQQQDRDESKDEDDERFYHTRAMVAHIWLQLLSQNSHLANVCMKEYKKETHASSWNLLDGVSILLLCPQDTALTQHPPQSLLHFVLHTLIPHYLDSILYEPLIAPLLHLLLFQFVYCHLLPSASSCSSVTVNQTLILDTFIALYPKLKPPQRESVITTFFTLTSFNVVELCCHSSKLTKTPAVTSFLQLLRDNFLMKKKRRDIQNFPSKASVHQMMQHGMLFLERIAKQWPQDLSNYKHILIDRLWLEQDKVPDQMIHRICAVLTNIHTNKFMLLQKLLFVGHNNNHPTIIIDQQRVGLIWAQHILKREPQHKDEITKWVVKCVFSGSKKLCHPTIGLSVLTFWKTIPSPSIFSHVKSMLARSGLIQLDSNTTTTATTTTTTTTTTKHNDTNGTPLLQFQELPSYIVPTNTKRMVFCISSFLKRSSFTSNHYLMDISTTMTFVYEVMDTYLGMGREYMKKHKWSPDGWLLAKVQFPPPNESIEQKFQLLCAFHIYIALSTAVLKHSYHHFLSSKDNNNNNNKSSDDKFLCILRYQISKIYTVAQEYAGLSNEVLSCISSSNNTNMKHPPDGNKTIQPNYEMKETLDHPNKHNSQSVSTIQTHAKTTMWKDQLVQVDANLLTFLCQKKHIPAGMLWAFLCHKEDNALIQRMQQDQVVTIQTCQHVFRDWEKFQDVLILRCAIVSHIQNLLEESLTNNNEYENARTKEQSLDAFHSICNQTLNRNGLWMLLDQTKILILFLRIIRKEIPSPTLTLASFNMKMDNSSKEFDAESSSEQVIARVLDSILDIVKSLVVVSIRLFRKALLDSRQASGILSNSAPTKLSTTKEKPHHFPDISAKHDKPVSEYHTFVPWIFHGQSDISKEKKCEDIIHLISSCEYIEIAWELLDLVFSIAQPFTSSTSIKMIHSIQEASWRLLLTIFVDDPLSKEESILFWHTLMHDKANTMELLPDAFQFIIEHYIETKKDEGVENNIQTGPRHALLSLMKFALKSTKPYKESYLLTRNILANWSLIALEAFLDPGNQVCSHDVFIVKILESIKGTMNESPKETINQKDKAKVQKKSRDGCALRIPRLSGNSFSVCFELLMTILCTSISFFVPTTHKCIKDDLDIISPYEEFRRLSVIFKEMMKLFTTNLTFFPRRTFYAVLRGCSLMIQVCEDQILACVEWRNTQPLVYSIDQDKDVASVQLLAPLMNDVFHNCANSILSFCSYVKKQTQNSKHLKRNKNDSLSNIQKGIIALVLRTEKFVDFLRSICASHNLVLDLNKPPSLLYEDLLPNISDVDRGYHKKRSSKKTSPITPGKQKNVNEDYEAITKLLFPKSKKRKRASLTTIPFGTQKDYKNKMFS